jgi:transcription antitermination factor NusG
MRDDCYLIFIEGAAMAGHDVVKIGHSSTPDCVVTYPPEFLPYPDEGEGADVILNDEVIFTKGTRMNEVTTKRAKVKASRRANNLRKQVSKKHRYKRDRPLVAKPKQEPLDPSRPLPVGLAWYVLVTSPNREYQVAHWREGHGDMTLCPLETRAKLIDNRRGGKRQQRSLYQVPVFPRLVMVGFNSAPNWLEVMDNFHIVGVLGFNGTPAVMRKGEAERIRASSESLRQIKVPKPLVEGGAARIVAPGMFIGHVVEISSLSENGKRAKTIQNWFGQKREVEMSADDLEAA